MSDQLAAYLDGGGHGSVPGAVTEDCLRLIAAIDGFQKSTGIQGSLAEIGVAAGKLFTLFGAIARAGERCVAIDVFDDVDQNYDITGGFTTLEVVRRNFNRFAAEVGEGGFQFIRGDSFLLTPSDVRRDIPEPGFRIFSVDGAHSHFHTAHDMMLAAALIVPGGVAMVDDIDNAGWPGVVEGVARYFLLADAPILAPFMIGDNKLWLTTIDHHGDYLAFALARSRQLGLPYRTGSFFDWQVVTLAGQG